MGFSVAKVRLHLLSAGTMVAFLSMFGACCYCARYYTDNRTYMNIYLYGRPGDVSKCVVAIIVLSIFGSIAFLASLVFSIFDVFSLIGSILNYVGIVLFIGTMISEAMFLSYSEYLNSYQPKYQQYCKNKDFLEFVKKYFPSNNICPETSSLSLLSNPNEQYNIPENVSQISEPELSLLASDAIETKYITVRNYISGQNSSFSYYVKDILSYKNHYIYQCYLRPDVPSLKVKEEIAKCYDSTLGTFDSQKPKSKDIKVKGCSAANDLTVCLGGLDGSKLFKKGIQKKKNSLEDDERANGVTDMDEKWRISYRSSKASVNYSGIDALHKVVSIFLGLQILGICFVIAYIILGFFSSQQESI